MDTTQLHHLAGYDYRLESYPTEQGKHRGLILLVAFSGTPLSPSIKIPTPTTFRTDRAAQIEASALAYQLILTDAIRVLVPCEEPPN